jgi:hypothetical protein
MAANPLKKRQELDSEIAKLNAEYLKASGKEADKLLTKINKLTDQWNKLSAGVKKWNDGLENAFGNLEDVDDELRSIGNIIGKNSAAYEIQRKRIEKGAVALKSISVIAKDNAKYTDKDRENLIKIGNEYKANLVSIANINRKYADGKVDLEEANKLIDQASEKYRENTSAIELSAEALKEVGPIIQNMNNEVKSFGNLAQKSLSHIQHLDEIFESFEGIPALGELNKLLKTNVRDTLAFKAAVFALGAALGKAAYDYFGAPIKAGLQADKERRQNEIDTIGDVAKLRKDAEFIPAQIGQERLEAELEATNQINNLMHEAAYAGQKAAIQFSASMQQGAAQFERAAKTALFGNKLGSVGYGAAKLQLAGISADKIASAMEAAGAATGKMPTASAAADMAIMAERTGQSVDDIASINEAFMRMDGMSANVAMNMQEGMRNMADQAGIGLGNLMKEVAQASKEALGYQIKSGPALAKAVAYTQSMGLNFGDVAKAGKNMVMNYKDSIKAEMQLSSMLGEQVDLAEVRAKFAAGDTEGALSSLKAQGLNPEDMDMFQQQALQDALGGMDLSSLQKVAQNTGKEVGLSGGNAKAGNQDFLSRTQSAEATMNAKQASISANSAVLDAKLSKEIADAYLASPEYLEYKKAQSEAAVSARELEGSMTDAWKSTDAYKNSLADSMKLNFVDGIKEKMMEGVAVLGGGFLTTALSKLIPGGGSGGAVAAAGMGAAAGAAAGGSSISDAVASTTQEATEAAATQSGGVFTRIGEKMDGVIASIAGVFTRIKDGVLGAWEKVTGWFTGIGTKISELWGNVTGFFSGIGTRIKDGFLGFVDTVKTKIMDGWNKVTGFFSGLIDTIKNFFKAKFSRKGITSAATSIASDASGGGEEGGGEEGGGDVGVASQAKAFSKVDFKGAGKGIGSFLQNVGKGAGTLIQSIMTGIANGLIQFANPLVVAGAAGLAASIVAVGAGLAGAAWIMGKVLPTLAEGFMSFNKVDGGNLARVGLGIGALGIGMAAMGAGAVIGGIGNLVGKLFGGGIEETVKKVQVFSQANINAARVKENSNAIVAYSKAMASSGLGSAASGLGNMVGGIANGIAKFFGAKPPILQMQEFSKLDFGDTTRLKSNAEAFTTFGNAMASFKGSSGSLGGVLADGVAKFFKLEPPVEEMKKFAAADFGDISKLKGNAEAFSLFGNAMATFKGMNGGLMSVLADGLANFFGTEPPFELFKKFAAMEGVDVAKTKSNAEAFTAFGNAMASYGGSGSGFWTSLGKGILDFFGGGDGDLIAKFREFAALDAGGVTAISTAIGSFNANLANFKMETAEAVGSGMSSVATATTDYLTADRTAAINGFASSIGYLNSQLMGLGGIAPMMETASLAFINLASALDRLAEVNTKSINDIPWIKMITFANAGGKIVLAQSANNSFNIAQDSAKNIEKLATDSKANLQISKNLQALMAVLADSGTAAFQLNIDGRAVTNMIQKRAEDRKASNPDKP